MKRGLAVGLLALAGLCTGCQGPGPVPALEKNDPALGRRLLRSGRWGTPASFRTVHRAFLQIGESELLLNGYLLVRRSGELRLLARSDMGGVAFEALRSSAGEVRILKEQLGLQRGPLKRLLAALFELLYFEQPSPGARLVAQPDGALGLVRWRPNGRSSELRFDAKGRRIAALRCAGGRVTLRADFDDLRPSEDSVMPWQIELRDEAADLRLSIQVLSLEAAPLADRLFKEQP